MLFAIYTSAYLAISVASASVTHRLDRIWVLWSTVVGHTAAQEKVAVTAETVMAETLMLGDLIL